MLRVFGSNTCEQCKLLLRGLTLLDVDFEFLDAMSPVNDEICDLNNVDALPHVQMLDDKGKVLWQVSGKVTLTNIVSRLTFGK